VAAFAGLGWKAVVTVVARDVVARPARKERLVATSSVFRGQDDDDEEGGPPLQALTRGNALSNNNGYDKRQGVIILRSYYTVASRFYDRYNLNNDDYGKEYRDYFEYILIVTRSPAGTAGASFT